jgi:hypothetical protein
MEEGSARERWALLFESMVGAVVCGTELSAEIYGAELSAT